MTKAVLRALLAAIVAWLTVAPVVAAVAVPSVPPAVYGYNAHASSAPGDYGTTERRPPASSGHTMTFYKAVDLRSHGSSARPDGATTSPAFAYDHLALLVQVASTSRVTRASVDGGAGGLSSFEGSNVAAKAGDEAFSAGKYLNDT